MDSVSVETGSCSEETTGEEAASEDGAGEGICGDGVGEQTKEGEHHVHSQIFISCGQKRLAVGQKAADSLIHKARALAEA